jgi:hypothetical protein
VELSVSNVYLLYLLEYTHQDRCHAISVKLKNGPLDSHPEAQGRYQILLSDTDLNGKPIWYSDSCAIWYSVNEEKWVLGLLQNLGTKKGQYIFSGRSAADNSMMPCEENFWSYHNMRYKEWQEPSGYGLLYNLNDINIQCTGNFFITYILFH